MNERKHLPLNELPYSAGLVSQSCWFVELKKMVQMIDAGKSEEEIRAECLGNNLFGSVKQYRAKQIYGYLWARTRRLEKAGIRLFLDSDLSTQKLMNLVTIVRGDRLFFEFIYEVYREKILMGQPELEEKDFSIFFRNKGEQSEAVERWTDDTKKKLMRNYSSCMTDANLLRRENHKRLITKPIMDNRLICYLKDSGDQAILSAITGEV